MSATKVDSGCTAHGTQNYHPGTIALPRAFNNLNHDRYLADRIYLTRVTRARSWIDEYT